MTALSSVTLMRPGNVSYVEGEPLNNILACLFLRRWTLLFVYVYNIIIVM